MPTISVERQADDLRLSESAGQVTLVSRSLEVGNEPMKIQGHGVDIVPTAIIDLIIKAGALDDWFSEKELAAAPGVIELRLEYLAGRIAAKEAVVKALGTGLIGEMIWAEVEIISDDAGKPGLVLHGTTKNVADERGVTNWFLSISGTAEYAMASAIATGD